MMLFCDTVTSLGEFLLGKEHLIAERKKAGDKRYSRSKFWSKYYTKIAWYKRAVRWLEICGCPIEDVSTDKWQL